jgi:hypothetical protein
MHRRGTSSSKVTKVAQIANVEGMATLAFLAARGRRRMVIDSVLRHGAGRQQHHSAGTPLSADVQGSAPVAQAHAHATRGEPRIKQ